MAITSRRFSRLLVVGAAIGVVSLGANPVVASNDSLFDRQWGLVQANIPAGWATTTGNSVRIGIVDSGVNRNHEDLAGRVAESATCVNTAGNMSQCTSGGDAGNDIAGHGSHVAGIAAATMGNGAGIAGTAPTAQLVVARVFQPSGNGDPTADLNDVKAGIEWVVAHGAKVVNLSLGVDDSSLLGGLVGGGNQKSPLGAAVEEAWRLGALPIVASGNGNEKLFGDSANYGQLNAIVVGSTIPSGQVASYSSSLAGTKWAMVAPGGDNNGVDADMILSTFAGNQCAPANAPNCYAHLSGTSMAAPMVSGAAALLLSQGLSRQQAVDVLLSTADKISCGSGCQGRLNVGKAVAVNSGAAGGGGPGTTGAGPSTPTTRKRVTGTTGQPSATTAAPAPTSTSTEPTSDIAAPETTTTEKQRAAIVLNTDNSSSDEVPTGTGLAAVALLAAVSLGTMLKLRRNATGV